MTATVRLVGIGPGPADLMTVRAHQAIAEADAVRHPPDIEPSIAAIAREGADVAPIGGTGEVVELAGRGRTVAVLYRGDPYTFSNGGELASVLARAGVDFEVVPGVLPDTAAPALSGIPLTIEGRSASVSLGGTRSCDTTVLRLASGWLGSAVEALLAAGRPPDSPAAILDQPRGPVRRLVTGPLASLPGLAGNERLPGDAMLVVGPGVEAADRLDTMSRRPLHGRRVLVTRARHQVETFRRQLAELGAWVVEIPTISIRRTGETARVRAAIRRLPETGLVIFTSANAVEIFFDMLLEAGADARSLHASRVCAIGPETARALENHGVRPELVAGEYTAEGLVEALRGWDVSGRRVLVPRAKVARDALPALLSRRGAEVEILPVYETVCPQGCSEALRRLFEGQGADVISFTSSSTVYNFARAVGDLAAAAAHARVACIGPVTADTARQLGLRVDIVARDYTTRGLATAIAESYGARPA
ncbi:MAG: uroporphyrinogen-III synthase [Candidatus Dormibacterales bacterium]